MNPFNLPRGDEFYGGAFGHTGTKPLFLTRANRHQKITSIMADNASQEQRQFLKRTAATSIGLASAWAGSAAESNIIKIALVGCGGRGTGAADQAMSTQGPTRLWAMADVFEHRLNTSL